MAKLIDINCDLGEGANTDAQLMSYISSCNIACGGHYGDEKSMTESIRLAKKHDVKIGAHPSFPDPENFGRQLMDITDHDLQRSIQQQVLNFKRICDQEDIALNHIKLHGALYNLTAKSAHTANVVMDALIETGLNCKIYVPFQSEITKINQNQFEIFHEAFIDRAYNADLSLVSRSLPNAIITEPKLAWEQLQSMVKHQEVMSVEGKAIAIIADTFCIHGDQPMVVEIMDYIFNRLHLNNLKIR